MKEEVFQRFLKNINIEDDGSFDMSFDMCEWSPFLRNNKHVLIMIIRKSIPWEYHLLMRFLAGISTIKNYQYQINYTYDIHPTEEDAYHLFTEWYHDKYNLIYVGECNFGKNSLTFLIDSNSEIIDFESFKTLLKTINYDFEIILEKKDNDNLDVINDISEEDIKEENVSEVNLNEESNDVYNEELERQQQHQEAENFALENFDLNSYDDNESKEFVKTNIRNIDSNSGRVDFEAKIFTKDSKTMKNGRMMMILGVIDRNRNAIHVIIFENKRIFTPEKLKKLEENTNLRIRGSAQYDVRNKEVNVVAKYINILPEDQPRKDDEEVKRVELHLHTKMSTMDGVTDIKDYIETAAKMGHKAIAVTDHGVVQAFPSAQKEAQKYNIKVLYGSELYVVDDQVNAIRNAQNIELTKATYVVFDFETTGLSAKYDDIIEFGAVKFAHGIIIDRLDFFVDIKRPLSPKIKELTGISDEMLRGQNSLSQAVKLMKDFIGDAILVSHNADFDIGFLNEACRKVNVESFTNPVVDTLALARYLFPESRNHRLGTLCRNMGVTYDENEAHRADYDAEVTNEVWQAIIATLVKNNNNMTHADLGKLKFDLVHFKHLRPYHVVALAKNQEGLKDLYKIISISHLEYFAGVPKVPRSILKQYRANLLLGSACFNGEIFDCARTRTKEVLKRKISFYDYIEIQPLANYSHLINMGEIENEKMCQKIIKDILEASEEEHKLVVATGDVHYLNEEDKIFRDVFIYAKAIGNINHPLMPYARENMEYFENPDQHFRTTKEMLEAFSYLGSEKAYELVVTNTNLIADSIEELKPVKDKLFTPTIENCENLLKDLCYHTAHEMYGENLPNIVQERLEKELNGIISNGYSVIYYIAHKIIKKANSDGYMVGSRGSVGSSFVATMANITEVNPLPPHYRCPHCKHSEFDGFEQVASGFDLPDKNCPHCGSKMVQDGQNIPFATFLGFNADKVPDIDLNFPGDYQGKAHAYTKELLGAENVFKAGTIETVAERNAYGYAKGYFERVCPKIHRSLDSVTDIEINYLANGCTGVKRTTGQHPGGIVVIPKNYEVYDFTPIQYPADDKDAAWKTTHFDFHAIHDNVLKLDLLGHVDPLALKMLGDTTGIDIKSIPMNDPDTLSIFSSTDVLKRSSNLLNEETGALGIPEFGTQLGRQMLKTTQPKVFSDLLILSGLSHGTGVWTGNAEELIKNGTCTLREVIGCRDDIMTYLSNKGVQPLIAFKIMEDVRKGKKVKPEYEIIMKENNVPNYYIESCNKIEYMFPKAHATAYVMMAIRVGWFKVHRPLDFYAVFLSVRSKQFELETMRKDKYEIYKRIIEIREKIKNKTATKKEEDIVKTLTICLEMVERGFKFENISLEKSAATTFIVDYENNCLIPPFNVIDGLGESAAYSIVEERDKAKFISKEDLLLRTKLSQTHLNKLNELGVLDKLDETNQLNLFTFFTN